LPVLSYPTIPAARLRLSPSPIAALFSLGQERRPRDKSDAYVAAGEYSSSRGVGQLQPESTVIDDLPGVDETVPEAVAVQAEFLAGGALVVAVLSERLLDDADGHAGEVLPECLGPPPTADGVGHQLFALGGAGRGQGDLGASGEF